MGSGQFAEDTDEIGVGIDAARLAGFDERVEISTGIGPRHGIGEQPVAAANDKRTDRVLAKIVVDGPGAILDIAGVSALLMTFYTA